MKSVFLSLLFGGAVVAVQAQQLPQDGVLLTFDEAYTATMNENPQIRAIEYQQRAAELERKAAVGLRLPQIGVGAVYTHLGKEIGVDMNGIKGPAQGLFNGVAGALGQQGIHFPEELLQQAGALFAQDWNLTLQEKDVFVAGVTVTLPVYTGGKINAANRAARLNYRTAVEQGRQSRFSLVSELVERYYGLVLAAQVVEVRRQVLEGMRVHLDDAIRLEANGIIARGERLYAEVKVAEAERDLRNAELQERTLRSALCNTLGSEREYIPVSTMFILDRIEEADYFKTMAEKYSPLLGQVAVKRDLAEEGVRLQRSEFLPQLALMGGASFYEWQLSGTLPRWAVGAGLSLKIFDGTAREHKFSAAKQTVRQVQAIQTKAVSDVGVMIDKLYNEMTGYRDRIPSIESSIAFAEEYLRIKEAAFREGMASSADVIDAQLNLAGIRTERIQAAYYYDLLLARLLEAAGLSAEFGDYGRRPEARPIRYE